MHIPITSVLVDTFGKHVDQCSVSRRVIFKQGVMNYELLITSVFWLKNITCYSRFKALPVGKSPTGLKPFKCYSIRSASQHTV